MRSNEKVKVSEIAKTHGGGGHIRAKRMFYERNIERHSKYDHKRDHRTIIR